MMNFEISEPVSIKSNLIAEGKFKVSAMAQRLISFCIYKMTLCSYEKRSPVYKAQFSFKEFLSVLGMRRCSQRTLSLIKQATEECQKAFISYENEDAFVTMPWFTYCLVDKKLDIVSFTFNEEVGKTIMDYSNGYIVEKIQILGRLQSYYAMRWYDLSMTRRGQMGRGGNKDGHWYCEYSIQDIRERFGIDAGEYNGRMDNFWTYVVDKPIAELNRVNTKYSIETVKLRDPKDARHVIGIRLLCTEIEPESSFSFPTMSLLAAQSEIAADEAEVLRLKDSYPAAWAEAEVCVRDSIGSSLSWTTQAYIDSCVADILRKNGLL